MSVSSVKTAGEEARELIAQRKKEIWEKVKNGQTEESIATGGGSFTEKEWDKLMERMDKSLELTKAEQKERFARMEEEWKEKKENDKLAEDKRRKDDLFEKESAEAKRKAAKLLEEIG